MAKAVVVSSMFFVLMGIVCMMDHTILIECKQEGVENYLDLEHKGTVKTIKGEDGDVIDCVDIYKQPAFDHPLVKTIQMEPSSYPDGMKPKSSQAELVQLWHKNEQCPQGTVPIRRTPKHDYRKSAPSTEQPITGYPPHEYAAFETAENNQYYGIQASINVWNPKTEIDTEFSLSQVWIVNREDRNNLNTIEAGWMVYPYRYRDSQTRFFIYWTSDGYQHTGCYDHDCAGFMQTNQMFALGSAIKQVSKYQGQPFDLDITIYKDRSSGNWWLLVQKVAIGYWPSSIFTYLSKSATVVQWGGEIINSGSSGHHTSTQMGSGHFPEEGYGKSSSIHNLKYVDNSNSLQDPQQIRPFAIPNPACYNANIQQNNNSTAGTYCYYGGPGYSTQCT